MSQLLLRRIFSRSSCKSSLACSFTKASTYHLPEGRYYAAPLLLKQQRKNYVLPFVLGFGVSLAAVSSVQPEGRFPLVAADSTMLVRAHGGQAAKVVTAAYNAGAATRQQAEKHGRAAKTNRLLRPETGRGVARRPDEERVNRSIKTAALVRHSNDDRPLLVTYQTERVSSAFSEARRDLKHVGELVSPARAKETFQITQGFVPAVKKPEPKKLPVPQMLASLVTNERPDILALGYAPADIARMKQTPFDSILTEEDKKTGGRFIPPIGPQDHAWAASPLPAASFTPKEQKCLAEAIYFESRGETLKGQAAVAQVVLNRVRNPAYPSTICGVVYQNVNWFNRCQFSFACDGKRHRVTEKRHWRTAQDIAKAVTAGQIWLAEVGSSTHYHAVYVRPRWARTMDKMQKIGQHIFYRTRGGGWI